MKVSSLHENNLTHKIIDQVLYEGLDDDHSTADCILVLGSKSASKYRVPKAVEVYKAERADKVIMCGGRLLDDQSEAYIMKEHAISLGLSEDDIILEEESLTTKENILCTLLTLDRHFKLAKIKRVLLVTTRYHMRRSLAMARTYLPSWIEIIPCPADDTNTLRHNWHLTDRGYNRAYNEVKKVISYIREGSISDFDIEG